MEKLSLIYVTTSSREEAVKIGRTLLEKKLCACINVWGGMESTYWWEGKLETAQEWVLLVKAPSAKVDLIVPTIKATHSYSTPCVLAWDIARGNPDYVKWLTSI